MKKKMLMLLLEVLFALGGYLLLLHGLAGTNIISGVFCPGPHMPKYYPVLIIVFISLRLYLVLLPGILLSRAGRAWMKHQRTRSKPKQM